MPIFLVFLSQFNIFNLMAIVFHILSACQDIQYQKETLKKAIGQNKTAIGPEIFYS